LIHDVLEVRPCSHCHTVDKALQPRSRKSPMHSMPSRVKPKRQSPRQC
jgi:hypothetical protein